MSRRLGVDCTSHVRQCYPSVSSGEGFFPPFYLAGGALSQYNNVKETTSSQDVIVFFCRNA